MSVQIIACSVFEQELAALGCGELPVTYVSMGLHDDPPRLRSELQAAIDALEGAKPELQTIVLGFGRCGDAVVGLRAARCRMAIPRADDCIALFLGGGAAAREKRLKHPDTYYASPGWCRGGLLPGPDREEALRRLYSARYPDDEEMVEDLVEADRDSFFHYRRLNNIETLAGDTSCREGCARCAESMGWSCETTRADLSLLRDLLDGRWSDDRFLVVPPGETIIAANDDRVLSSK